jgi:hypothetical protein
MKKFYNKFLIVSTTLLAIGGIYFYLSNDLNSKDIVPVAFGSSLASSTGDGATPISALVSDEISSDISFLTTLVSIKNLQIDVSLFTNESFNKLQNNAVKIEQVIAGRINPFAPIESAGNSDLNSVVITNQPTQVTNQSVVLNGTINTTDGVTDTYFEYGVQSQGLNNVTAITKQSLIGTFIKNVSGLAPKTSYLFKACAKINNIAICGETVSFTTK